MPEPLAAPSDAAVSGPAPEEAPGRKRRGGRRVLLGIVLPSVLLLGLLGGGVTYTAVTVSSADRTAPTRVWEQERSPVEERDPAAVLARGRADTPLSKLLLPLPEGWDFGPDEELHGNDGELGPEEAAALMKKAGEGLAGKKRRTFEKGVDRLGIEGIAVRSFVDTDNDVVVSLEVARMKDKKHVKDSYRLRKEVMDILEFPKGPKVKDHRNAVCYLMPEDEDLDKEEREEALEQMICLAYDAGVYVTFTAAGAKPFDKARVVGLLAEQLDHLESPGEYV